MTFTGFPDDGLELLKRLPTLDRDAFGEASETYQNGIVAPAKAFVGALGPELRSAVSDGIQFVPRTNGSIAPINNDRRFNPAATPYKDHLLFRFWEGQQKQTSSTLFVRVAPDELGFAVGRSFSPSQIEGYRAAVDRGGDQLAAAVAWLARYRNAEIAGASLKRVPAPYSDDHAHADLLRHKRLQIRWLVDPKGALNRAKLVRICRDQLGRAADVHRWLVECAT